MCDPKNCESCGGCTGCAGELTLTPGELRVLETLSQVPFLPIGRRADGTEPVCPADPDPETGLVLLCLEKKNLVSLDYDRPLKGFDGGGDGLIWGSMALTGRGQAVVELIQIQGVSESTP